MKWNNQRKIAVGLLGLASVAFLADRFLLQADTPESLVVAPASDAKPGAGGVTGIAAQERSAAAAGLPMAALARRMEEICLAEGLSPGAARDAFTPPSAWFPAPPPAAAPAPAAVALPSRASDFKSKFKLTAVMRRGAAPTNGLAVIQGETIRIGQIVGGFKLMAINDRSVVLSDGAETVELELPTTHLATVQ